MIILTKKDIFFYLTMFVILVFAIFIPISLNSENVIDTVAGANGVTIVVDAGHGAPDGGAVSANGIEESVLNLQIAKKVKEKLEEENYNVIMTREDENNVADENVQSKTIREIKSSDLNNRVKIANECDANMLLSIHMNKFEDSKYRGWQTFYSEHSKDGKLLAESIQIAIGESVQLENKRTALKISGIKIIDHSKVPAVIVECGFLSNMEECELLQNEEYQEKLASGICIGVKQYLDKI